MVKTIDYDEWLHERLKDHSEAAAYINAHIDDYRELNEIELFFAAILNVAKANSGDDLAKVFDIVLDRYKPGNVSRETLGGDDGLLLK